jgi:S-adenosylmethionine:tRNA ribosyltransferase-isomerase
MKKSDFHYDLPPELIAQAPLEKRTDARLLILTPQETIHGHIPDILDYLSPTDLLVFNNTKVFPARLYGHKETGGKVEFLVETLLPDKQFWAMAKSSKALRKGMIIKVPVTPAQAGVQGPTGAVPVHPARAFAPQEQTNAKGIVENSPSCEFFPRLRGNDEEFATIEIIEQQHDRFLCQLHSDLSLIDFLNLHGHMPLPPYIHRADTAADKDRYQTVFAKEIGAIAAPTAGLHFDETLLQKIKAKNINTAFVTLHVGAGTFQPLRADNIEDHHMHTEWMNVSQDTCDKISEAKARGGRVIAIGTTVVRCLETAAQSGQLQPYEGNTNIFIYPPYTFKAVDVLFTNFHLPESTLLMLVCAFGGYDRMMHAYHEAVKCGYRFFSYGDAMLIFPY